MYIEKNNLTFSISFEIGSSRISDLPRSDMPGADKADGGKQDKMGSGMGPESLHSSINTLGAEGQGSAANKKGIILKF